MSERDHSHGVIGAGGRGTQDGGSSAPQWQSCDIITWDRVPG